MRAPPWSREAGTRYPLATDAARPEPPVRPSHAAFLARTRAHFLFNVLHSIGALVRLERNDQAVRAIAQLSELQRTLVERDEAVFVPLADELRLTEHYLDLERLRFGDALETRVELEPGLENFPVPNLLLLPLVENAVKHGIGRRWGAGRVFVAARSSADGVEIVVRNAPPVLDRAGLPGAGFGLWSVRERLQQHYGGRAALSFQPQAPEGATVAVTLPR